MTRRGEAGDERRDNTELLNQFRLMVEKDRDLMKEYFDNSVEILRKRVEQSHIDNRQLWRDHAGPSADSQHGQEAAKRLRHYQEHAEFREKSFDPLVERVNEHKWRLGLIAAAISLAAVKGFDWIASMFKGSP